MRFLVMAAIAGMTLLLPLSSPSADEATSVSDLFVNGPPEGSLDDATLKRLDAWLPEAIRSGISFRGDRQRSDDIIALSKSMGYEGRQVREREGRDGEKWVTHFSATGAAEFLKNAAERDAVLKTATELPSTFDIYDFAITEGTRERLSGLNGEDRRDSIRQNIGGGVTFLQRKASFDRSDFPKLDIWLPNALAGQGELPDDAESQALFVTFAERLGWSNEPERPGNANRRTVQRMLYERAVREARATPIADKAADALNYLKQEQFLQKTLIVGGKKA